MVYFYRSRPNKPWIAMLSKAISIEDQDGTNNCKSKSCNMEHKKDHDLPENSKLYVKINT